MANPVVTCLDMEGVVAPEIWLAVADHFQVEELKMTTRDIPDYDELMQKTASDPSKARNYPQRNPSDHCRSFPVGGGIRISFMVKGALSGHYSIGYVLRVCCLAHETAPISDHFLPFAGGGRRRVYQSVSSTNGRSKTSCGFSLEKDWLSGHSRWRLIQ